MSLYAGTSGWAYPSWKPDFYPPKLAAKNFLHYYSTQLNSVEVNYTFRSAYSMTPVLSRKWIEQAEPGFSFAFKAPQAITHQKQYRLQNAAELVDAFTSRIRLFADAGKLGPVLFQLPPFFAVNLAVLEFFLRDWPKDIRCAFEFRHKSWFDQPTYDVLHQHNAALCIAQSDKLETPEVVTADFVYYRLRRSDYKPAEIRQLTNTVREHLATGRDVHAYFKHEDESVESTQRALALLKAIAGAKSNSAA